MGIESDNIQSYIASELNPPPGQGHTSTLYKKKNAFLGELAQTLQQDPYYRDKEGERQKVLERAAGQIDQVLTQSTANGLKAAEDGTKYIPSVAKNETRDGVTGMVESAFDSMIGSLGGMFGFLWNFIKHLPFVGNLIAGIGDWVSDKVSGKTPEQKKSERLIDGAVAGLSGSVEIEGQVFSLSQEELGRVRNSLTQVDFTQTSQKPSAPAPAMPANVPGLNGVLGKAEEANYDNKAPTPVAATKPTTVVAATPGN